MLHPSTIADNVTSFPALECLRAFEPTDFEEARASERERFELRFDVEECRFSRAQATGPLVKPILVRLTLR
jgi:hypothetical protein